MSNWLDEVYSEEHDEMVLSESNESILQTLMCKEIARLKSELYRCQMISLERQRKVLSLTKANKAAVEEMDKLRMSNNY